MKRGFMEWSEADREGMFTNIKELWEMNTEHAVRKESECRNFVISPHIHSHTFFCSLCWQVL